MRLWCHGDVKSYEHKSHRLQIFIQKLISLQWFGLLEEKIFSKSVNHVPLKSHKNNYIPQSTLFTLKYLNWKVFWSIKILRSWVTFSHNWMTALSGYRGDLDCTSTQSCPAVLKWSSPSVQSLQDRHELSEVYSRLDILIYNLTQYSREKDRHLHQQMVSIGIG